MTRLVGADPSNTPFAHPIRWPGSWHRKPTPRLARIVSVVEGNEIDLGEAMERSASWLVNSAAGCSRRAIGASVPARSPMDSDPQLRRHGNPEGPTPSDRLQFLEPGWHGGVQRLGRFGRCAGGISPLVGQVTKYDEAATEKRWRSYHRWRPDRIGHGSLMRLAQLYYYSELAKTLPPMPEWMVEAIKAYKGVGR